MLEVVDARRDEGREQLVALSGAVARSLGYPGVEEDTCQAVCDVRGVSSAVVPPCEVAVLDALGEREELEEAVFALQDVPDLEGLQALLQDDRERVLAQPHGRRRGHKVEVEVGPDPVHDAVGHPDFLDALDGVGGRRGRVLDGVVIRDVQQRPRHDLAFGFVQMSHRAVQPDHLVGRPPHSPFGRRLHAGGGEQEVRHTAAVGLHHGELVAKVGGHQVVRALDHLLEVLCLVLWRLVPTADLVAAQEVQHLHHWGLEVEDVHTQRASA